MANLTKQQEHYNGVDSTITLEIYHLPMEAGEDVADKVNMLIKDGAKLEDKNVESPERKVNMLIKDGANLEDINVESAERKKVNMLIKDGANLEDINVELAERKVNMLIKGLLLT